MKKKKKFYILLSLEIFIYTIIDSLKHNADQFLLHFIMFALLTWDPMLAPFAFPVLLTLFFLTGNIIEISISEFVLTN